MKIGIIGGSGFYALEHLKNVEERQVDTPFGKPSGPFIIGTLGDHEVVFLARHGPGHCIPPSALPHRANIYAMKVLGVDRILAITAVGSLKEECRPGDIVFADQYFDRLKQNYTFFDNGIATHVAFGEPVCTEWRKFMHKICAPLCKAKSVTAFDSGTYVCMEGPAFSTRAESNFYRMLDASVIGMTSLPEAKLAREAEICYCAMSLVTDYDCWRQGEESVTVEAVMEQMKRNIGLANETVLAAIDELHNAPKCSTKCGEALCGAIMTRKDKVSEKQLNDLAPIITDRMQ